MMNEIMPNELKKLLDEKVDLQLIDVRTADKHAVFNIGGINIPYEILANYVQQFDANKLTITYCTSGNKSMRALELLKSFGFTNVKSLQGGMNEFSKLMNQC